MGLGRDGSGRRGIGSRLAGAALVLAAACTSGTAVEGPTGVAPTSPRPAEGGAGIPAASFFERVACRLPPEQLQRIKNGYSPGRSGEVQIVPKLPHVMGQWLAHSGPWDFVQRVPLFLYGPGHVPPVGDVQDAVTVADLAPTLGRHLRFDVRAPDGRVLEEAVGSSDRPPKLIVVAVWDAAGRNVLDTHPDSWPTLRRLRRLGAWFENATVGSSPSVTPSIHGTIGTGAFPRRHGLIDLRFRVGGSLKFGGDQDVSDLRLPTLADRYDRALGNRPIVAGIASKARHLAMVSRGSWVEGGDQDVAALRVKDTWDLEPGLAEYFRVPDYLNEIPGLPEAIHRLDLEDGEADREWMGRDLDDDYEVTHTPAFTEYQALVVEEVIRREGLGAGGPTDLLFINYNEVDRVGHTDTMNSPQMEAVVRATDRALARLVRFLDRQVGAGEWVLALTADHGSTPDPSITGGTVISPNRLQVRIDEAFGEGSEVVESLRVTQIWMNERRLERNGYTLGDVARFVLSYTKGQNGDVPEGERDDRLFAAAFPSKVLQGLRCG